MTSDFQKSAGRQGRDFEKLCANLLTDKYTTPPEPGFKIETIGVQIDMTADGVWFECKGSWNGGRPGLIRTDTAKKAIANGALIATLPDPKPYIILTSHMPEVGSGSYQMLMTATLAGFVTGVVCINNTGWGDEIDRWVQRGRVLRSLN